MGDIERPVGVGERRAIADVQLEAIGRRQSRRRQRRRPRGPRAGCRCPTTARRRPRARARSRSAIGMSAPPVPTSSSVSASTCAAERVDRRRAQVHATEVAIDPPQVAQVAGQRRQVVERTVEQLDGVGAAVHRCRVRRPRPSRPATLGAVPRAIRRLAPFAFAALLLAGDDGRCRRVRQGPLPEPEPRQPRHRRPRDPGPAPRPRHRHRGRRRLRGHDPGRGQDVPGQQRPDRRRHRRRRDVAQADRAAQAGEHRRGGQRPPAPAQREASRRADRQRPLRHPDPQRRHRLPEACRDDAARQASGR